MRETSNYKLSQWEKTDRIEMEDFNADNSKVDAALAGLAEQLASKASQADLPWVKIGEATLKATTQQVRVTIPNVEQYSCFFLIFDVSGSSETGLLWQGMSNYTTIVNRGKDIMTRCCGFCLAMPLPKGGMLLRCCYYSVTANGSSGSQTISVHAAAVTSGNATVSITGRSGNSTEPLAADSHLTVYGLKQ